MEKNLSKQGNRCCLYRWESLLFFSICPKFHSINVSALKFEFRYMYTHLHIHTSIFNLPLEEVFLFQFAANWYLNNSHAKKNGLEKFQNYSVDATQAFLLLLLNYFFCWCLVLFVCVFVFPALYWLNNIGDMFCSLYILLSKH